MLVMYQGESDLSRKSKVFFITILAIPSCGVVVVPPIKPPHLFFNLSSIKVQHHYTFDLGVKGVILTIAKHKQSVTLITGQISSRIMPVSGCLLMLPPLLRILLCVAGRDTAKIISRFDQ